MAKKYYAVRRGKTRGIYLSWNDCKAQVEGFPGAEYKGFAALSEAEDYLRRGRGGEEDKSVNTEKSVSPTEPPKLAPPPGSAIAYVDGSFDKTTTHFSYGMVLFAEGEEHRFSERIVDPALAEMHNVAGEIKGAQAAMQYCLDRGIAKLDLYYDYEGIAKWCLGAWQAKKAGTVAYANFYHSIKDRLAVRFIKVKGHSGDPYNDLADRLAKEALGIKA